MNVVGRVEPQFLEIVSLEDIESEELGGTLTRRCVLINGIAAVRSRNRLLHLGGIFGEVLVAEEAAVLLGKPGHFTCDVSFIETIAGGLKTGFATLRSGLLFGFDHSAESPGEVGILPAVARSPAFAIGRRVEPLAGGILLKSAIVQRRTHRHATFAQLDGRLKKLAEGASAPT